MSLVERFSEAMVEEMMTLAYAEAKRGSACGDGGPFGAVVVNAAGEVLAAAHNRVLAGHDPTAHAEVVAIRTACEKLQTHDLAGCTIFSSCEPCPMCLSAIIWANIGAVYFGGTRHDAAGIGFRDQMIYDYLAGAGDEVLQVRRLDRAACRALFEEYQAAERQMY